ncbi:zinc finger protein-like 1 [Diorhabda carinulata]|uniref:zinc finger protein-like 1 n=1 Tax=Diorhabda carinulata TaxID=1163345 RepID=UPI0025A28C5F|nr:zinc finger protein-like 1 [Diorhabda carinulata]
MGLCKCPKRRVTNQFCFEHRVCVCENCMVTNHPICIVQSYLQWLQDSDYNSICELCSKDLNSEDCIRLTCYHVFHWSCLDHFSRQLPPTTAPRGYTCPSCKSPLFPASNLISPVADVLKEKLAGVNWARAGLGLPLLSEEREVKATVNHMNMAPRITSSPSHSIVSMDEDNRIGTFQNFSNRRVFQDIRDIKPDRFDHDDNKYKRKPLSELVGNWFKITFGAPLRSRGKVSTCRYFILAIMALFIIVTFFFLMSKLRRYSIDDDPNLDIGQNAFIKVGEQ